MLKITKSYLQNKLNLFILHIFTLPKIPKKSPNPWRGSKVPI